MTRTARAILLVLLAVVVLKRLDARDAAAEARGPWRRGRLPLCLDRRSTSRVQSV
jgi:hypothetical protein